MKLTFNSRWTYCIQPWDREFWTRAETVPSPNPPREAHLTLIVCFQKEFQMATTNALLYHQVFQFLRCDLRLLQKWGHFLQTLSVWRISTVSSACESQTYTSVKRRKGMYVCVCAYVPITSKNVECSKLGSLNACCNAAQYIMLASRTSRCRNSSTCDKSLQRQIWAVMASHYLCASQQHQTGSTQNPFTALSAMCGFREVNANRDEMALNLGMICQIHSSLKFMNRCCVMWKDFLN